MGGQGSGRPPDMIKMARAQEAIKTIAPDEGFVLPNYSGLQAVKKTDPPYSMTETDPVFMALSGSLPPGVEVDPLSGSIPLNQIQDPTDSKIFTFPINKILTLRSNDNTPTANEGIFNFEGIGNFTGDLVHVHQHTGNAGVGTVLLRVEGVDADALPLQLSGSGTWDLQANKGIESLTTVSGAAVYVGSSPVLTAETDPIFNALSGSFITDATDITGSGASVVYGTFPNFTIGSSATGETDPVFMALSGSFLYESLSGSLAYIPTTDYGDFELSGSPTFMNLSGSLPYLLTTLSGSIPTYLHQSLSGSWNIDLTSGSTHFGDSSNPHGTLLTQTYISLTSGSVTADSTISGSGLIRNVLIGTETSGSLTASNYPQGTIYLKYT